MPSVAEDLAFRGLVHQVSDPSIFARLDAGQVTAYAGFDPTADSLHVGHLVGILTLRRLQLGGNRPILLAGGGTGLIGDPGGKDAERPMLSAEEIAANVAGVRAQLGRFLELSDAAGAAQGLLLDNSAWLSGFSLIDFLRDVGKHVTVNQMIAKESVKARIDRPEQGISFTEFSYMLLQAADYLHLYDNYGCTLQLGGSDQWGNITTGCELIRKTRGGETHVLTWPLLLRPDGTKYGKSEDGAVWLDPDKTSPFALYQWFVRAPDDLVGALLRYFTFLGHDEIAELDAATAERPERRLAQRALAASVCALVHGEAEAARAEAAANALYSAEVAALDEATLLEVFADAPSSRRPGSDLDGDGLDLVEALTSSGLVASSSAARRALEQGAVYVNNVRRGADGARIGPGDLLAGRYVVVRHGKRDYHLLRFG